MRQEGGGEFERERGTERFERFADAGALAIGKGGLEEEVKGGVGQGVEGGVEMSIKKWRVGLNYSQATDGFEQETILLVAEEGRGEEEGGERSTHDVPVYISEKWLPSHTDLQVDFFFLHMYSSKWL